MMLDICDECGQTPGTNEECWMCVTFLHYVSQYGAMVGAKREHP